MRLFDGSELRRLSDWFKVVTQARSGHVLVSAIIAAGIISGMGVVMMNRATTHVRHMQLSAEADQSWYLAMAGIEDCMAKLRWDGTSWSALVKDKKVSSIPCNGSLVGGTYAASAVQHGVTTALITSTGTYGKFTKKLVAIVQWQAEEDEDAFGTGDLQGGGNWRFSGSSTIEGNIATTGDIVFSGSSVICGNAYAGGMVSVEGSAVIKCGQAFNNASIVKAYYDPIDTWEKVYEGDMTCPSAKCKPEDFNYSSVKINGILTIKPSGNQVFTFPGSPTIMANGYVIDGNAGAEGIVKLYSMSNWGADPLGSCPETSGNPKGVGVDLVMWVKQGFFSNVIVWLPNGKGYFVGSQGGGQEVYGVYGKIFAQCVETRQNWNFFPGADKFNTSSDENIGYIKALTIIALYEE